MCFKIKQNDPDGKSEMQEKNEEQKKKTQYKYLVEFKN